MGVSNRAVHRTLSQARLQPYRLERYMTSNGSGSCRAASYAIGADRGAPRRFVACDAGSLLVNRAIEIGVTGGDPEIRPLETRSSVPSPESHLSGRGLGRRDLQLLWHAALQPKLQRVPQFVNTDGRCSEAVRLAHRHPRFDCLIPAPFRSVLSRRIRFVGLKSRQFARRFVWRCI